MERPDAVQSSELLETVSLLRSAHGTRQIELEGAMQCLISVEAVRWSGLRDELRWMSVDAVQQTRLLQLKVLGYADEVRLFGHVEVARL